ncbi:mismatch-specific DNA-glycosylase [Leucobacter chromiireducens]|uniref:Mismatch-specific DNA-glycosylase n=1 Tax=Leucobacter chromiireducens subsp. chromiireducens TaxID=660067 RepID=A0ABS1SS62_9MICO|nr:mismatch-specific DNA-glycosylase [Leucobacter chromiireducens]MBL3690923.1 mismatch-specific DNA-glycosylase [Leucobacter chromiireducens subsp. chromiireducens]
MSQRRPSPLGGARPRREELARFASHAPGAADEPGTLDDVLPDGPGDPALRLLIVGVNPGLWTAAVNAPFAYPGNRFWPSLHRAGLTDTLVDASRGLSPADERQLIDRGIGITNLIGRATAAERDLTREEYPTAGRRLVERISELRPHTVAIAGIGAFRKAFAQPRAALGRQDIERIPGWPTDIQLWVVPQPSGLNAHETVESLAEKWRAVWADSAEQNWGSSGEVRS